MVEAVALSGPGGPSGSADAPPLSIAAPAGRSGHRGGRFRLPGTFALVLLASFTAPIAEPRRAGAVEPGWQVAQPARAARQAAATRLVAETAPDALLPLEATSAIAANVRLPFNGTVETMAPFRLALAGSDRERAIDCLAAAAWYEAGDDPRGERAVMQVVLNRVRHPSYPDTVCGVVFQGSERTTGCQFTFTCDGALARVPGAAAWQRARQMAQQALDGAVDPQVGGATHYHADYVLPRWAPRLEKLAQVGAHIFYRFPGSWGRRAVFTSAGYLPEPAVGKLGRLAPVHIDGTAPGLPGDPALADRDAMENARAGLMAQTFRQFAAAEPAAAEPSSAIMLAIDPEAPPGRWAVTAMDRCRGRADCQVLAWASSWQTEANRTRAAGQRDRPVFLFLRDRGSGMETALWDCTVAARPDKGQCLPTEDAALQRLMRPRPNA